MDLVFGRHLRGPPFFMPKRKESSAVTHQPLEDPDDSKEAALFLRSPLARPHAYDASDLLQPLRHRVKDRENIA